MPKGRVFILEGLRLKIDQAAAYGPFVYIFGEGQRRSSIWVPEFQDEILERLKEEGYDPMKDYILIAGHMVSMCTLVATLTREYKRIRVLFFCSTDRTYTERVL